VVKQTIQVDICIIGGGPAGSTIAYRLVSLGYKVCLLEAKTFPRPHVGMSLTPAVLSLLETINARKLIENANFLSVESSLVWWTGKNPRAKAQQEGKGLHVDRGEFDQLLLNHAQQHGAQVLQATRAKTPKKIECGLWETPLHSAGEIKSILSHFIVDASGGRSILKQKKRRLSPALFSIYAYWHTPTQTITDGAIEAGTDEWYWFAQVNPEKAISAVFIDPKRIGKNSSLTLKQMYLEQIDNFKLFQSNRNKTIIGDVHACDASSWGIENPVGKDFIHIGNSSFSMDPLSSQGVQAALISAFQAAVVINTLLRYPQNKPYALSFYKERHQETIQRYTTKTADFYAERAKVCDTYFWRERASKEPAKEVFQPIQTPLDPQCKIELSKMATMETMAVMVEDQIIPKLTLQHQNLERPISYLGGVEIVPLLQQLQTGQSIQTMIEGWAKKMPQHLCFEIIDWLWQRQIIVLRK